MKNKIILDFMGELSQQQELEKLEKRKKMKKTIDNMGTIDNLELMTLLEEVGRVLSGNNAKQWDKKMHDDTSELHNLFKNVMWEIFTRLEYSDFEFEDDGEELEEIEYLYHFD